MKRSLVAGALLVAGVVAHAGTLPKHMVDRVAASCVLIQAVEDKKAQAGSGFFVGPAEVLTNYHVVKTAAEGEAKVVLVVGTDPRTRKLVEAEVVAGNEELDLALLRAGQRCPHVLRFAPERSLRLTQQVWVAGFPFGTQPGLEVTLTAGTISSLRRDDAGKLREVQLDAAVNPGNSGGPVVDATGNVVGVSRATIKPTVGSGMAIAIPCGAAQEFLKAGRQARSRTSRLLVRGRPSGRGLRVVRAEKAGEIWGTSVRLTVRGTRQAEDVLPLKVEVSNRRREVVATETIDTSGLKNREEKTYTIRLRGIDFDDVANCRIVE